MRRRPFDDGGNQTARTNLWDPQLDVAGLGSQDPISGRCASSSVQERAPALRADHLSCLGLDQGLEHQLDALRITSMSAPACSASGRSDTSDCVRVTGSLPSAELGRSAEDLPVAELSGGPRLLHHPTGRRPSKGPAPVCARAGDARPPVVLDPTSVRHYLGLADGGRVRRQPA
jgi:hypothetical protein